MPPCSYAIISESDKQRGAFLFSSSPSSNVSPLKPFVVLILFPCFCRCLLRIGTNVVKVVYIRDFSYIVLLLS